MAEFFGKIKYYSYSEEEKRDIIHKISDYLKGEKVVLLSYIYGSFIKQKYLQDIDIGMFCNPGDYKILSPDFSFSLSNELEYKLKPYRIEIDLKLLNEMPAWFRFKVLKNGLCIYRRDELTRVRYEKETIREYLDLKPIMEFYDSILLKRIQNG